MSYDNYSTDGAICPHCGHLSWAHDDNYSLYSEDTTEFTCGMCGEEFAVSVFIQHSWTTEKSDD